MPSFFDFLLAAVAESQPFALGIISGIKGSSPQKKGAKAIFFADGREPAKFDLVLDHDFGWDDGLICGGKVCGLILPDAARAEAIWRELALRQQTLIWGVEQDFSIAWVSDPAGDGWLYQETVSPPCALWIAGSGHVAQAVAPLAQQLDFEVTVFDDRPALANHRYFPPATRLRVDGWEKLLRDPLPRRPAFGLIVTRGHQHDALVLREWVHRPFAFLGMVGSHRKKRLIFSQFREEKIASDEQLDRVACPVGLDIQAVSVPEIALSIMAQLVQKRAELTKAAAAAAPLPPARMDAATASST